MRSTESRCEAAGIEVRSTEAFLFNWGDAPGIKVRSTESRRKVPWIEVRNTEAFNLNWGDAQTWLATAGPISTKIDVWMDTLCKI